MNEEDKDAIKDGDVLTEKLLHTGQNTMEIQETKKALTNDIIELSRILFEEANDMVSREARLRISQNSRYLRMKQENNSLNEKVFALESLVSKFKEFSFNSEPRVSAKDSKDCHTSIGEYLNSFGSLIELDKITNECDHWEKFLPSIDSMDFKDFNRFINRCNEGKKMKLLKDGFVTSIIVQDIIPCLLSTSMSLKECNKTMEAIFESECTLSEHLSFKDGEEQKDSKICIICKRNCSEEKAYDLSLYTKNSGPIDHSCRQKIVACCTLTGFVKHLELGIYNKRPVLELYIDLLILKRLVFYARTNGSYFYTHFDRHSFNFLMTNDN